MKTSIRLLIVPVLLLGSITLLVVFGILGPQKPPGEKQNSDGIVLYAAGQDWMQGNNPYAQAERYDPDLLIRIPPFFYPPQISPLCLAMAIFPYETGSRLWLIVNLLSVAALAWISVVMIRGALGGDKDHLGRGLLAAIIICNNSTLNVIWMGQTSLLAAAFAMASWLFYQRKQWLLAGIFLALASFKPQLCLLLGVWFLLERDWKTLLSALAAGLVLCLYPMLVQGGPIGMLEAWKGGIDTYRNYSYNQLSFEHLVGLQTLLAAGGLILPGWPFTLVGVALTVLVWVFQHHLDRNDLLGILMGITFLFVGYSHDYDYAALVPPLLVALWPRCRERPLIAIALVPLLLLLIMPQMFVRVWTKNLVVLHWRTLVVVALTLMVISCSLNRPKGQETLVTV